MPRPLIIKVDSHKSQPSKKATGSINITLLKGFNKVQLNDNISEIIDHAHMVVNDEEVNPIEESGSHSMVRSLISRYETSPEQANLVKYKSKSLVDLQQKPQISIATNKTTQDDFLYNKGKYNDGGENQKFDFKTVFLKFETSSQSRQKTTTNIQLKHYKPSNYCNNDSMDLASLKQKAKALLEQYQHDHEYSSWQDQVIELLHQLSGSVETTREVQQSYEEIKSSSAIKKQENIQKFNQTELNTNLKVKDIKNIFENTNDNTKPISRSVSSYATYFGVKSMEDDNIKFNNISTYSHRSLSATPFNDDFNNNQMESERSEESEVSEDDSDVIEGKRIVTQPVLASSMKIQELKNFFESDSDKYVPYNSYIENEETAMATNTFDASESDDIHILDNRMLPPPKMLVLDSQKDENVNVENSKQRLEELTKDIEDYEQQIDKLPETNNNEEGTYINELLIRVLIKLDGIKTYGNAFILTERRKAIQFCTNCISKLGEKVKGKQ